MVSALVRAGAQVTFHTTPDYRAMVETTGARVALYPSICEQIGRDGRDMRSHVRDLVSTSAAIAPSLAASGPPADLVVFDASALWGRAVAREWGTASSFRRTSISMSWAGVPRALVRPS